MVNVPPELIQQKYNEMVSTKKKKGDQPPGLAGIPVSDPRALPINVAALTINANYQGASNPMAGMEPAAPPVPATNFEEVKGVPLPPKGAPMPPPMLAPLPPSPMVPLSMGMNVGIGMNMNVAMSMPVPVPMSVPTTSGFMGPLTMMMPPISFVPPPPPPPPPPVAMAPPAPLPTETTGAASGVVLVYTEKISIVREFV